MGRVDRDVVLVGEDDSWSERYIARAYGSACSAPSRSVRPTAPTRSEPPVSSSAGSSAAAGVRHRVGDVLRRVAGRVEGREAERADVERLAVADGPVLVARAPRRPR